MSYEANEPCIVTKLEGRGLVTYHHLLTKKAYPEHKDSTWNLIPVSQKIHLEFHQKGMSYMANKYPSVERWLIQNDWYVCESTKKWRH